MKSLFLYSKATFLYLPETSSLEPCGGGDQIEVANEYLNQTGRNTTS